MGEETVKPVRNKAVGELTEHGHHTEHGHTEHHTEHGHHTEQPLYIRLAPALPKLH